MTTQSNKKIRILHTEWSDGWGGQEIRIINEMAALREEGVDVFLACTSHSSIKTKAIEERIEVLVLPFRGLLDFRTLFGLIKFIKLYQIDIVNTHSGKDTWVGGIAAIFAGVKFIRTRHLSNDINQSRLNFINELADFIMTTGTSIKNKMIKNNRIQPDKIESIPTGIDSNVFNPKKYDRLLCRKKFEIEENEIVFGMLAVLRKFKRHDRFLIMAKHLINENRNKKIKFLIAGAGPRKEFIENQILKLGLDGKVLLLGHISETAEFLNAIDVFVLPSDSGEGVPQSLIQSLMMNKPSISTNAGSINDLLYDNNFLVVDKDSQEELNVAADRLVKEANLLKLYSNSRKVICEEFSKDAMTKKILSIYDKVIND